VKTPEPFSPALLDHRLAEHNRSVLMVVCLTLAGALILWPLAYFMSSWLWLLGTSVTGDYQTGLPEWFPWAFVTVAIGSVMLRFLIEPYLEKTRWERKILGPHLFLQIPLIPASLTREIVMNIRALVRFDPSERKTAIALLQEVWRREKLPVQEAGALTTNARRSEAVAGQLLMIGLLEMTRTPEGYAYRKPIGFQSKQPTRIQSMPMKRAGTAQEDRRLPFV